MWSYRCRKKVYEERKQHVLERIESMEKEREKLMIFYFTGTGNSLWAAKEIGKELNQPVENIIKQKAIFSAKTI